MKITKEKVRVFVSILSFVTMSSMVAYIVVDDVLLTEESRRTVEICREEVQRGCPLTLEALEEMNQVNKKISERNEELRRQVQTYKTLAAQMETQCVLQSVTPDTTPSQPEE